MKDPIEANREPKQYECSGSCAEPPVPGVAFTNFQWTRPLSEILQAIIDAGLALERIQEHPMLVYQAVPQMVEGDDGYWRLAEGLPQLPLSVSLRARK